MSVQAFVYVDDEPISNSQVYEYLKATGQFNQFLASVLRQHVISKALVAFEIFPTVEIVQQCLLEFCEKRKLTDDEQLQGFLTENNLAFSELQRRLASDWARQQLICCMSEPSLQDEFISRRGKLDKLGFSCIALDDQGRAEELRDQITEEQASFEELARAYSLSGSRKNDGRLEPGYRGDLPEALQLSLGNVEPGSLIGPLEIDGRWYLYRLDEIIPASLEGDLEADLRATLFEEQVMKEISQMEVKLQVTQWQYLQTYTR